MRHTDRIKEEITEIAAGVRLCQRRLSDIRTTLDASGERSEVAQELRRAADNFSDQLTDVAGVLEYAATRTEEDLEGVARPALANNLECDLDLLRETSSTAVETVGDLAAASAWMMEVLPPADRQMLIGLCELFGSFEAGIGAMPGLLAIVGTSTDAAFALEDLGLLCEKEWQQLEDIGTQINAKAVLFLLEEMIQARLDRHRLPKLEALRDRLQAIEGEGDV